MQFKKSYVETWLDQKHLNLKNDISCRSLLTLPSSLGWIGGRPTHSLYFLGFQEDDLIHLGNNINCLFYQHIFLKDDLIVNNVSQFFVVNL